MNVDETEISLDTSNTRAGGRPAVSFHDPHLPATSRSTAKLSLACTGIFGSSTAGECVPLHFQLPTSATAEKREKIRFEFLTHTLDIGHTRQIWLRGGEDLAVHNRDE